MAERKPLGFLRLLHPLCFVLSPWLALFSVNFGQVTSEEALRPLCVLLSASALLWPLIYLLLRRNAEKASLALSAFLLILFLFPQCETGGMWLQMLCDLVRVLCVGEPFLNDFHAALTTGLWFIICSATLWLLLRVRRDLTGIAWVAGIALIAPSLLRIGTTEFARTRATAAALARTAATGGANRKATDQDPDLYVVVLDAYARQDILKEHYAEDNEPFLQALEKRGFLVDRWSRANYFQTPLAVSAALNLDYIAPEAPTADLYDMQPFIDHNRIAALLTARGYHFLSIPTGFELTATPSANLILNERTGALVWRTPFPLPFESMLLQETPYGMVRHHLDNGFVLHRNRLMAAFNNLGAVAQLSYPKFVFAHILAPHPPFVFKSDGTLVYHSPREIFTLGDGTDYKDTHEVYHREYAGQIQYVNQRVLEAVDRIHATSTRPYVIVLMGDHGARCNTDWGSRARTDVREASSNLFAVYCPACVSREDARRRLSQRMTGVMTPVNGLRLVLNAAMGTSYPELPDRSFYSTVFRPYDFDDVSEVLTKPPVDKAAPLATR